MTKTHLTENQQRNIKNLLFDEIYYYVNDLSVDRKDKTHLKNLVIYLYEMITDISDGKDINEIPFTIDGKFSCRKI